MVYMQSICNSQVLNSVPVSQKRSPALQRWPSWHPALVLPDVCSSDSSVCTPSLEGQPSISEIVYWKYSVWEPSLYLDCLTCSHSLSFPPRLWESDWVRDITWPVLWVTWRCTSYAVVMSWKCSRAPSSYTREKQPAITYNVRTSTAAWARRTWEN